MPHHFTPICRRFFPHCSVESVEEVKVGHINRTYKVTLALPQGKEDFLLQAVNTYVFKQPELVMENIAHVTAHLQKKAPEACTLRFCTADDGKNYAVDESGFWRLVNYIPSVTHSAGDDLRIVAEAGKAFGQFQQLLADFDADSLHETIPNFHNTKSRYAALRAAAEADSVHRRQLCEEELSYLLSMEELACTLTTLHEAGKLPLRVTHNDTKINNVLFDADGHALCVIDLDTVMPGLVGHDFGDAIRSAANTQAEDSIALDKVTMNPEVFRAFADSFLQLLAPSLSDTEIDTLATSAFVLTAEVAVRFLTDYLQGDVYFKTAHAEHNLQRARCQIALAKSIHQQLSQLCAIIHALAQQYR